MQLHRKNATIAEQAQTIARLANENKKLKKTAAKFMEERDTMKDDIEELRRELQSEKAARATDIERLETERKAHEEDAERLNRLEAENKAHEEDAERLNRLVAELVSLPFFRPAEPMRVVANSG